MKTKLINSSNKLIFYIVLISSSLSFGQSQFIFNKINQTKGLSNDRISSIVKEKNGFVWIGTENGLNRYDGNKIKIYNKQNSTLSSNDISALLIDRKGKIWIATFGGGLNLYDPINDTFITYKNILNDSTSVPTNELNTLFEDSNGTIWLGTKNGFSFLKKNEKKFKTYKFESKNINSISHNDVRSVYEDNKKNLWIGTFGGGLNRFNLNTRQFIRIKSTTSISADYIYSVCGFNNNEILIGTNGNGLLTFDLNSSSFQKGLFGIDKSINVVECIKKTRNGTIWFGTDGFGLFNITNSNSTKPITYNYTYDFKSETSISGNAIYSLMEDESSNIWVGTAWNGVDILSPIKDYTFIPSYSKGESPVSVLSIYKNNDAFFMGLDGKGMTFFKEDTNLSKQFNKAKNNSIGDDYIQYIKETKNGLLWIGTFANGLVNFNYKTGSFTQFKQEIGNPKSLSFNDVRYIVEDDKYNMWIATWGGGLNYFNISTNEFTSFKQKKGDQYAISSDNVISLQKDGDLMWIATFGGGVNLMNTKTKRFTAFRSIENNKNSISSDYVYSILKDTKGNVWIGTAGEGINQFNIKTKTTNRFDNFKDIRYQTVTSIIEDNQGLIWFSTKQGIYNYDYSSKKIKSYAALKGDFHINSSFKDEKGLLYFGCATGVFKFNPDEITVKNTTPVVKFTSFKLFNKEVSIGKDEILKKNISNSEAIILKHDQDVITLDFAAMLFPSSSNCEYQIKMENFDDNWRSIGKEGSATYTNLSPGKYIFKVKSREIGSDWTDVYSSIAINISKPFWTEWWAFLFYIISAGILFYISLKYFVSWQKMKTDLRFEKFSHEKDIELYNIKQDFFTNISHEIRTPVTLILSSVNRLLKNNVTTSGQKQNQFDSITKNGEYLLNLVNELLDFRKLEDNHFKLKVAEQDVVKFCNEVYLSFLELAAQKDIKLEFKTSTEIIYLWFDKNLMTKVLYNLFSNALKFTDKGQAVVISISETNTEVTIELIDEGIGISTKQLPNIFNRFYQVGNPSNFDGAGFGLGLTITHEIIKLHHGAIDVKSKKGAGSTFTIKLKKGNSFFSASEIDANEIDAEQLTNYFVTQQNIFVETSPTSKELTTKEQTLLIVEDNEEISDYIDELLSDEFNILKAFNGQAGLEIAIEKTPDLIISDVMMPIMNGIDLTYNLKTHAHTSHIPVVLLTAKASLMNKIEGFETGADDYITKPFNETLLRARIKNILRNRSLLHEKFQLNDTQNFGELVRNKKDQEFLENLGQFIEKNIDTDNLNANLVSKELGMSHSVLYKKLKMLTGLSLIDYMRDYRLKKAKQLLSSKQFTIIEVSNLVGYSDRKYFSKLFKERFGNPPTFYLK